MSNLLSQASLVMIPSGYKEDVVYSQIPTNGNGDLSFTRASNGTRVNSAGLVEVCPWNLCDYSEDQTQWTSQNQTTVTANSTTAPNGTLTADTVTPTAVNDDHYRGIGLSSQVGALTAFIYVKPNGYNFFDWGIWNGSQYIVRATFDLVNLTYTFTNAGTATIESVGNGWLKCGISGTNASLSTINLYYRIRPTGGTGAFTGNGTSGAFIWGAQLNIGSTAKPYLPTTDRLNVPRLTYQNGGGGCPSLLLEKQSTNLELWSQDLTNAVYSIGGGAGGSITTTANYAISPDGTQNATRLQIVRGSSYVEMYQRVGTTIGVTYTFSFYVKSLSGTPTLNTVWNNAYENEVTFTTEWVRYTYTFVAASTTSGINLVTFTGLPNTSTTADILVWGVQLEASSYPTSYIPTTSSSATRVADACSKTGISSLIGQTEGVMFVDINTPTAIPSGAEILPISLFASGAGTGGIQAYVAFLSNGVVRFVYFTGSVECLITTASGFWSAGNRYKLAAVYKQNDFAFYINGVQIGTDNSGNVSAMADFYLDYQGLVQQNTVNQCALFKTRLTNAELASLTTI